MPPLDGNAYDTTATRFANCLISCNAIHEVNRTCAILVTGMALVDPGSLQKNDLLTKVWRGLGEPRCYLTGGFLRDHLLGRFSTDVDLSVPGDAEAVAAPARRLAETLDTRAHLLGEPPRCVWRVEKENLRVELWPMGDLTLNRDIQRRDYSINALMWDLQRKLLIDRVDGTVDLVKKRLRALSRENLRRDPIRLLRGARFLATLDGFELEEQTAGWIRELAPQLDRAPRERIGHELSVLVTGAAPARGLQAMITYGLVETSAPTADGVDVDWSSRHFEAADRLAEPDRHPIPAALQDAGDAARLALILRTWGSPRAAEVADYAWNRRDRRLAAHAADLVDRAIEAASGPIVDRKELIYLAGQAFPALLALGSALADQTRTSLDPWRRWWRQWSSSGPKLLDPPPLLAADEVIGIVGSDSGRDLGVALRGLERAQARGEVRSASGARKWLERQIQNSAS